MMRREVLALLCLLCTTVALSQKERANGKREGHHEIHTNNIEFFSGITAFPGGRLPTIGLDYEHRFGFAHQHFGGGVLADYEFGHQMRSTETLLTPTVFYFPNPHWKIFAGFGVAHLSKQSLIEHHAPPSVSQQTYGVFRSGMGYETDLSEHLVFSPSVFVDHTSLYTAIVGGLALGLGY